MAKQSGLHQIRGKVGEHSYYKQTGVAAGLIRSINQGLSARVKTGGEYVNTRLNNAEFGQACRVAACLGRLVVPKYRPMILPFSQSKMAKMLLEIIKQDDGAWGTRNIHSGDAGSVIDIINSVSKNDFASFGISRDDSDLVVDELLFSSKLQAIDADGVQANILYCTLNVGKYRPADNVYIISTSRFNTEQHDFQDESSFEMTQNYPAGVPALLAEKINFLVVVLMPYRTIDGTQHILQEHCAFAAIEWPELP